MLTNEQLMQRYNLSVIALPDTNFMALKLNSETLEWEDVAIGNSIEEALDAAANKLDTVSTNQ